MSLQEHFNSVIERLVKLPPDAIVQIVVRPNIETQNNAVNELDLKNFPDSTAYRKALIERQRTRCAEVKERTVFLAHEFGLRARALHNVNAVIVEGGRDHVVAFLEKASIEGAQYGGRCDL